MAAIAGCPEGDAAETKVPEKASLGRPAKAHAPARVVQFPTAYSLGTLSACPGADSVIAHPPSMALGPARGRVFLPADSFITLTLVKDGCEHPEWFSKIPANTLGRLSMNFVSMEDKDDGLSDHVLACASALVGLKQLTLTGADITDAGLAHIANLTTLTCIEVGSTGITGSFLAKLSGCKNLTSLSMGANSIKSEYLRHLSELQSLRILLLDHNCLDAAAIACIGQCKELRELNIGLNPGVTDQSVKYLANLKHLQSLNISGTSVSVKGLVALKDLPIAWLSLPNASYSQSEMQTIKSLFPRASLQTYSRGDSKADRKEIDALYAPLH